MIYLVQNQTNKNIFLPQGMAKTKLRFDTSEDEDWSGSDEEDSPSDSGGEEVDSSSEGSYR